MQKLKPNILAGLIVVSLIVSVLFVFWHQQESDFFVAPKSTQDLNKILSSDLLKINAENRIAWFNDSINLYRKGDDYEIRTYLTHLDDDLDGWSESVQTFDTENPFGRVETVLTLSADDLWDLRQKKVVSKVWEWVSFEFELKEIQSVFVSGQDSEILDYWKKIQEKHYVGYEPTPLNKYLTMRLVGNDAYYVFFDGNELMAHDGQCYRNKVDVCNRFNNLKNNTTLAYKNFWINREWLRLTSFQNQGQSDSFTEEAETEILSKIERHKLREAEIIYNAQQEKPLQIAEKLENVISEEDFYYRDLNAKIEENFQQLEETLTPQERARTKISPNYVSHIYAPDDSRFDSQWGLKWILNGNELNDYTPANSTEKIVVAVIDSGINHSHKDLQLNQWKPNGCDPNLAPENCICIAPNGTQTTCPYGGYDVAGNDNDPSPRNNSWHGTFTAGLIGASTNNSTGIASLGNNSVEIMSINASIDWRSFVANNIANAIRFAIDNGAQIINMSLGGTIPDITIQNLIKEAWEKGIWVVAAAGNSATDNDTGTRLVSYQWRTMQLMIGKSYPASYALGNIISVASSDKNGAVASFSNYGKSSVDVAVPWASILSTKWNDYYTADGTSFSAPLFSASMVSTLLENPNATKMDILQHHTRESDKLWNKINNNRMLQLNSPEGVDDLNNLQNTNQIDWNQISDNATETCQVGELCWVESDKFYYKLPNNFDSNQTIPLWISFHGQVGQDSAKGYAQNYVHTNSSIANGEGFIFVAPQGLSAIGSWTLGQDENRMQNIIAYFQSKYNISHVFADWFSAGANFLLQNLHDNTIDAFAITEGAAYNWAENVSGTDCLGFSLSSIGATTPYAKNVPIYIAYGNYKEGYYSRCVAEILQNDNFENVEQKAYSMGHDRSSTAVGDIVTFFRKVAQTEGTAGNNPVYQEPVDGTNTGNGSAWEQPDEQNNNNWTRKNYIEIDQATCDKKCKLYQPKQCSNAGDCSCEKSFSTAGSMPWYVCSVKNNATKNTDDTAQAIVLLEKFGLGSDPSIYTLSDAEIFHKWLNDQKQSSVSAESEYMKDIEGNWEGIDEMIEASSWLVDYYEVLTTNSNNSKETVTVEQKSQAVLFLEKFGLGSDPSVYSLSDAQTFYNWLDGQIQDNKIVESEYTLSIKDNWENPIKMLEASAWLVNYYKQSTNLIETTNIIDSSLYPLNSSKCNGNKLAGWWCFGGGYISDWGHWCSDGGNYFQTVEEANSNGIYCGEWVDANLCSGSLPNWTCTGNGKISAQGAWCNADETKYYPTEKAASVDGVYCEYKSQNTNQQQQTNTMVPTGKTVDECIGLVKPAPATCTAGVSFNGSSCVNTGCDPAEPNCWCVEDVESCNDFCKCIGSHDVCTYNQWPSQTTQPWGTTVANEHFVITHLHEKTFKWEDVSAGYEAFSLDIYIRGKHYYKPTWYLKSSTSTTISGFKEFPDGDVLEWIPNGRGYTYDLLGLTKADKKGNLLEWGQSVRIKTGTFDVNIPVSKGGWNLRGGGWWNGGGSTDNSKNNSQWQIDQSMGGHSRYGESPMSESTDDGTDWGLADPGGYGGVNHGNNGNDPDGYGGPNDNDPGGYAWPWHADNGYGEWESVGANNGGGGGHDWRGQSCFTAGTKIITKNWGQKNIEDIEIGDMVIAKDGKAHKVTRIGKPKTEWRKLYALNDGQFNVTPEHPFLTTDGWKAISPERTLMENPNLDISKLEIGDILITTSGTTELKTLESVNVPRDVQLYNLHLDWAISYNVDNYIVHSVSLDNNQLSKWQKLKNWVFSSENTINYQAAFLAGTKIELSNGTTKPIEELKQGTKVSDTEWGVNIVQKLNVKPSGKHKMYSLNNKLTVSDYHPFLTTTGWRSINPEASFAFGYQFGIGKLRLGQEIIGSNGNVKVNSLSVVQSTPETLTYELELDGNHLYYAEGFAGHNPSDGGSSSDGGDGNDHGDHSGGC